MKSLILIAGLVFISFAMNAQELKMKDNDPIPANAIKINLGSIILKNIALQYERVIGNKTSVALGIRFQPFGSLPFKGFIRDKVNDPDILVDQVRIGNVAVTPEFRYYFGKSAMKGVYIASYARYANYKMSSPVNYTSGLMDKTAFFSGNISSISGGILLGHQFRLSGNLLMDFWILGGHFGSSSGQLSFIASLTPQEQDELEQSLDNIDIPLFNIEHDINSNGGIIRSKGAWAGFRGLALNLVYRF